ncbi:IS5 family transposase [Halanaeroarchaeum sulfurireducens]|uniref:IS5 family transposase n=1 Tax=Halanaeroarchaeum sulfurireducens TaxID=1604004 RepID=UPI001641121E|nr:IS5 family transposase [Halanaeroarchaeum sulfurireducens]
MSTKLSRFTSKVVSLAKKAVGGESEPPVQKGEGGYADWVIVGLHGLREYLGQSYRRLLDVLHEMPGIVAKFDLSVDEMPDFTTVCTRKQDLEMRIWRVLLRLSADLQETGEVKAIDATGLDRVSASQHYANRTNYTFRSVKTTALIDCETSMILDIHCSMTQPHDTQIGWQVMKQNLHRVETLTVDKGYDWDEFRRYLRKEGVRPVIKHRGFSSLDAAHNARIDDEIYHRRSVVESVFASLRRRFDDTIRARTWFGQFREIVLKAAVKNIEAAIRL